LALLSTWSRRKREAAKAASGEADVYQYESPSRKLRERVRQLINEFFEEFERVDRAYVRRDVLEVMRKELGVPCLSSNFVADDEAELDWFILNCIDVDDWLSCIEMTANLIRYYAQQAYRRNLAERFVNEMNACMLEDCFGYQFDDFEIIQISSQFFHSEVVVPVFGLLSDPKFSGANSEFRQAHAEFRVGEYEDCIHDCCNAFESVLKVILQEKGWQFQPTDTAKSLIAVAFANNLIPAHLQSSFTGLRTILESGVPTVRNRNAGHGTGASPRAIPKYLAEFQLHQTAAAILLLVEAAR
jgi:hypothetical protein